MADSLKDDLPDDERIADAVMVHNEGIMEYQTKLSLLPSAQPERQKGHWIFDFAHNEMTCSECGRIFTGGFDLDNADNFCRYCGSDNRGEQDDVSR